MPTVSQNRKIWCLVPVFPKRWDLSRLAESPAADEAVLAEQGLEGWAANLDAEDR